MKTRYSVKNAIAGLINMLTIIVVGILTRIAVVRFLGIEYQGVDGLFSNIMTMLSIAELGIGPAIIYHLYRPLEENDTDTIRSLMHFYKKCYTVIALFVLAAGLFLVPFLPFLIKDYSLPYPIIFIYIWFLLDSSFSYVLSYNRSIIIADQKNYVISIADTLYVMITKITQILILWKTRNFILFLAVMVVFRLAENVIIHRISLCRYPYLSEKAEKPLPADILTDIKRKVKGALFHNIGGFIITGTDNILISKFLGLALSGIYSNYYLILRALQNVSEKVISAATASIGHMLAVRQDHNDIEIFNELQLINVAIVNCAAAGIYCVETPVIRAFFGSDLILDDFTLFILAFNFCIQCMRYVYNSFKQAAGIVYEDRLIPVISSVINIITSIILLKIFGISGVFMGTILSTLIYYVYTYPVLVYKGLLKQNPLIYIRDCLWRLSLLTVTMITSKKTCSALLFHSGLWEIIGYSAISVVISSIFTLIFYAIWRKETKNLYLRLKPLLQRSFRSH